MKRFAIWPTTFWLLLVVISSASVNPQAASGSASNEGATPTTAEKNKSNRPRKKNKPGEQPSKRNRSQSSSKSEAGSPSDSEIAAAKSGGKVWVNLDSGIYHKNGRWYGNTKNGKFMTEAEAKAAGYKASQRN